MKHSLKNLSAGERHDLRNQIGKLDDYLFMMLHFEPVSSKKQIENGTFAFIVKQKANSYKEDKVLVAYASGYLRTSIYNHAKKQIALRYQHTGYQNGQYRVQVYGVLMRTQNNNKLEMYKTLFARMRAYVEKHKLV